MSYANGEWFGRWLEVRSKLGKDVDAQRNIAQVINQYYYSSDRETGYLGEGETHIVFRAGFLGDLALAIKTKLERPYNIEKGYFEGIVEQIVGYDDAFRNGKYPYLPKFLGIVSWGKNLALLTEDLGEGGKYPLEPPFHMNEQLTHVVRTKEGIEEKFFVDPLIYDRTNEQEIFQEFYDARFELPEEMMKSLRWG